MKILVTGATGFIGSYLTQDLLKEKHEVFALVRQTSKTEPLKALGVRLIYGDITDEKSLEQARDHGIEAVFHCAAIVKNDDWKRLFYTNVIGTENICKLCLELKVDRLVYLSSVAVVSGHEERLLCEDLPYSSTNLYGASKIDAEKKVIEFRKRGLRVAILRPPMVYGEEEPHALGLLLSLLRFKMLPLVNQGSARWHLAYVKNVTKGLMLALSKEEALKKSFFVADEEVLTVKEIFSILTGAMNCPAPFSLPACLNPLLVRIPYAGSKFEFFLKDRVYDISRIKSFGYKPEFSAPAALAQSARYWLNSKK
ncbi:MAG: NAD(P)-dependent oxidoreductase [Candidatus Omnitrophica bacterium]|nr:NAD(P)-dependent oxidoreductase [Candidatus Omnitrophota bacterium]